MVDMATQQDVADIRREIAKEFSDAFSEVFRNGKTCRLELLVQKILLRYGGLLWDGYSSKKS